MTAAGFPPNTEEVNAFTRKYLRLLVGILTYSSVDRPTAAVFIRTSARVTSA